MKHLRIGLMLFLIVLEAPRSTYQVEVKDHNGDVIYSDVQESLSYNSNKLYNLSDLNNGRYTFEVKLGDENEINDLIVNNGTIQLTGEEEQITPTFKLDGKYLNLTFPNLAENNVRILIYDKTIDKWIFQEKLSPENDIQQALNLSQLHPGNYRAELISGVDSYNYDFDLN